MPRSKRAEGSAASPSKRTASTEPENDSKKSRLSQKQPHSPAKKRSKKDSNQSEDVMKDFEDEMDGIQQFINETEMSAPKLKAVADVIEDEFEPAAPAVKVAVKSVPTFIKPPPPVKKATTVQVPSTEASKKFAQLAGIDKATEGRCGSCEGCSRRACRECSACKRQEYDDCIDLYCTNQKSGLSERAAIRELYLQTLKKQKDEVLKQVEVEEVDSADEESEEEYDEEDDDAIQEKVDQVMAMVTKTKPKPKEAKAAKATNENSKPAATSAAAPKKVGDNKFNVVYGGSSKASKVRRCGECEGCTRDDCGQCFACLDKPRFGGKGTKKKACTERFCRLKAGKVP